MRLLLISLALSISSSLFSMDIASDQEIIELESVESLAQETTLSVDEAISLLENERVSLWKSKNVVSGFMILTLIALMFPGVIPGAILMMLYCGSVEEQHYQEIKTMALCLLTPAAHENNFISPSTNGTMTSFAKPCDEIITVINQLLEEPYSKAEMLCIGGGSCFSAAVPIFVAIPFAPLVAWYFNHRYGYPHNAPLIARASKIRQAKSEDWEESGILVADVMRVLSTKKRPEALALLNVNQALALGLDDTMQFHELLVHGAFSEFVQNALKEFSQIMNLDEKNLLEALERKDVKEFFERYPSAAQFFNVNWHHDRINPSPIPWPDESNKNHRVTLRTDENTAQVDRQVLDHISAYFATMDADSAVSEMEQIDVVDFTDGSPKTIEVLAVLCQRKLPVVTNENLLTLLKIAQFYQISALADAGENFLMHRKEIPEDLVEDLRQQVGDADKLDEFAQTIAICRLYGLERLKMRVLEDYADTHRTRKEIEQAKKCLLLDEQVFLEQRYQNGKQKK